MRHTQNTSHPTEDHLLGGSFLARSSARLVICPHVPQRANLQFQNTHNTTLFGTCQTWLTTLKSLFTIQEGPRCTWCMPCTCSCKKPEIAAARESNGRLTSTHYFASADLDRFVLVLGLGRLGESAERDLRRTKTTKTTTAAVDRSWRRCKQQSLGRKFRAFLTRNSPHNMCRGWLCKHIKAIWYTKHLEFLIGSISS